MITPDFKDKILKDIILKAPHLEYGSTLEDEARHFQTSEEIINAVLSQFDRRGFIEYNTFIGGSFMLHVSADAHDYILRGGHLGEYEYLERQVAKLEKELEALKPVAPKESFDRIKGILDTVLSAVSTYNSFQ